MNNKLEQLLARHHANADDRLAREVGLVQSRVAHGVSQHEVWMRRRAGEVDKLNREEKVRRLVRDLMATFKPAVSDGVPEEELLWGVIRYAAGALACYDLDEPVDLKVRRLGRNMAADPIFF